AAYTSKSPTAASALNRAGGASPTTTTRTGSGRSGTTTLSSAGAWSPVGPSSLSSPGPGRSSGISNSAVPSAASTTSVPPHGRNVSVPVDRYEAITLITPPRSRPDVVTVPDTSHRSGRSPRTVA